MHSAVNSFKHLRELKLLHPLTFSQLAALHPTTAAHIRGAAQVECLCCVPEFNLFFFLYGALLPLSFLSTWSVEPHSLSLPRPVRAVMAVDPLSDE